MLPKNVTTAVRTPRFAVLVENNEKYWKAYINGIVQSFSQTWGGEHFIIIPTDGKTIDKTFWQILEAYSPDYIGRYIPTLLDMEEAEPAQYEKIREHHRKSWKLTDEQFEENWLNQLDSAHLGGLEVDDKLKMELKNRLSPFHFEDHTVSQNVFRNSFPGFPFTQIEQIVESAVDRPTEVVAPLSVEDDAYRLLALSRAGVLSGKYSVALEGRGFTVTQISTSTDGFRLRDYITALDSNEYEPRMHQEAFREQDFVYPPADFMKKTPFALSLLHLGKYYKHSTHREWEENKLVIVGDTMADYCLYYCLSRLHEGVYWMPDEHLSGAHKTVMENNARTDDAEVTKFTVNQDIAAGLVWGYFKAISYGHHEGKINITSISLSARKLQNRREWMSEICFSGDFSDNCNIISTSDLPLGCVVEAIELNNHANQQDMVFQYRKSIGRLNTPKPKNFTVVNPAEHRWITSVNIDGYHPPALPFIGSQVIKLRNSTNDTRAAKGELAYFCPNIGYFGGDIDVNTVRPGLELITDSTMFESYFAYSGYSSELSDKGSYLKDTVSRFGSLEQTAAFFKQETKRSLFSQYLTTKQDKDDDEIIYLSTEKRAYISFKAFERKLEGEDEAVALVDELISKDILSRGLIFQCSRCRKAGWYDIASVSNMFTCTRCGLAQAYNHSNWKSPAEPKWYYRLAETVYLFYESSSHITVLALDKLRQEAPENFHYVSETNIINPAIAKPKQEIDVLAIVKGEIIFGECKDCPVKPADIRKYLTIYSQLNIQPASFLLATTELSVSQSVQTELNKFQSHRTFTASDLYS